MFLRQKADAEDIAYLSSVRAYEKSLGEKDLDSVWRMLSSKCLLETIFGKIYHDTKLTSDFVLTEIKDTIFFILYLKYGILQSSLSLDGRSDLGVEYLVRGKIKLDPRFLTSTSQEHFAMMLHS